MINAAFIFAIFVSGNVLLTNGFGAIALQRNKNSFLFILINSTLVGISIFASAILYNVVFTLLLKPYLVENLGILVIILLAGLFNFASLELIKLTNKEMYYYYDSTYSFVINLGITIAVLMSLNLTGSILETLCYSGFCAVCYILTSLLFATVYKRLHNKKVSKVVRPVPITILTMAVLAMIIYAVCVSI